MTGSQRKQTRREGSQIAVGARALYERMEMAMKLLKLAQQRHGRKTVEGCLWRRNAVMMSDLNLMEQVGAEAEEE